MDITGAAGVQASASMASSAIKDTLGAQLIGKTLDKLNTGTSGNVDSNYQFQKDVLSAAGIGNKIDTEV